MPLRCWSMERPRESPLERLTPRQVEIMEVFAETESYAETARRLGLSSSRVQSSVMQSVRLMCHDPRYLGYAAPRVSTTLEEVRWLLNTDRSYRLLRSANVLSRTGFRKSHPEVVEILAITELEVLGA